MKRGKRIRAHERKNNGRSEWLIDAINENVDHEYTKGGLDEGENKVQIGALTQEGRDKYADNRY